MKKVWQIAPKKYDDIIKQLLCNRGIDVEDSEAMRKFLDPDFSKDFASPGLFSSMEKSVLRLKKAVDQKETIGIFADYDADGIPGAALFFKALAKIDAKSVVFIPNRESGYGLSQAGIDYLIKKGCTLILTIDLGIRSFQEADYCVKKGIDLIITDHHLIGEDGLPSAYAVIHPRLGSYPEKNLCGCGVVFKLVQALSKIYPKLGEKFLKWNLDLAAISTIADVVPLTGENRLIAKFGLIVFKKTKNIGLQALCDEAQIKPEKINAYSVGFQIAPRLNAPGRLGGAVESFKLLVTEDKIEAKELASNLNQKNGERQEQMDRIIQHSIEIIERNNLCGKKFIIVSDDWPRGVIGPSASRLVDRYNLPVIIFAEEQDGYVGSARSIHGIHILKVLDNFASLIEKYGGHSGAAGLTVSKDKFQLFNRKLIKWAEENIDSKLLARRIRIDAVVALSDLNLKLCKALEQLEPFGMGNPKPIFKLEGVNLVFPRRVGNGEKHLSFYVESAGKKAKAIFFGCNDDVVIQNHKKYDIIFNIGIDSWGGEDKINLTILDLKER